MFILDKCKSYCGQFPGFIFFSSHKVLLDSIFPVILWIDLLKIQDSRVTIDSLKSIVDGWIN